MTLHTIPETGPESEPYNAGTSMSSRGSGGNAEEMGQRGRGIGHDALHGHVMRVQEYNGAENNLPGPATLTVNLKLLPSNEQNSNIAVTKALRHIF